MIIEVLSGTAALTMGILGTKMYRGRKRAMEAERKAKLLQNLSVTVFVRESNGSRTDLEHHVEQEFISRGARVLLANQENATTLIKRGEYHSPNTEAHLALIGTLVIKDGGFVAQKIFTEDEHTYNLREAEWEAEHDRWLRHGILNDEVEPQLRARGFRTKEVPCLLYQFSYRIFARDGSILASGSVEEQPLKNQTSFDGELRSLAEEAISTLDERDVWQDITI